MENNLKYLISFLASIAISIFVGLVVTVAPGLFAGLTYIILQTISLYIIKKADSDTNKIING